MARWHKGFNRLWLVFSCLLAFAFVGLKGLAGAYKPRTFPPTLPGSYRVLPPARPRSGQKPKPKPMTEAEKRKKQKAEAELKDISNKAEMDRAGTSRERFVSQFHRYLCIRAWRVLSRCLDYSGFPVTH